MNYSHILPNLIVGSVPQDTEDIDYLRNHLGVTAILNLQEEKVSEPPLPPPLGPYISIPCYVCSNILPALTLLLSCRLSGLAEVPD